MPSYLKSKIERSVYNRRRKRLFFHTERLRKLLVDLVSVEAEYFIVDSMPVEICRLSRCSRSSVCRDRQETAPDKGCCASQHMWYYGYKLHAVCFPAGVIHNYDLFKASVHYIFYLNDIKQVHHDCVLLGDRGYLRSAYQLDLFETANKRLKYRLRGNQHHFRPQFGLFRRFRKRIETIFSQLCDQFMIRRNYAKTFDGFKTRIQAKITTMTTIQLINKLNNRNINNLKNALI